MAVKIRFNRVGKKNRPYFRIVAIDSRKKRDGECLELLGTFDPVKNDLVTIKHDNIQKWISVGAQCTDSVKKVLAKFNKNIKQNIQI